MAIADKQLNIYQTLRQLDPKHLTDAAITATIAREVNEGRVKDAKTAKTSAMFLHRVAWSVTEEEWAEFTRSGQVPPLKMSPQEMELVRGGYIPLEPILQPLIDAVKKLLR